MGAYSGLAFQAATSIGGGYVQANSLRDQADYEQKVSELNQKTLDYQATQADRAALDVEARGKQAANKVAQQTRLKSGEQRAAAAAAGVSGSELEANVLEETAEIGAANEATLKINSYREAFGMKSQANAYRGAKVAEELQTRTRRAAYQHQARSSIITGYTTALTSGAKAYGNYSGGGKQ